MSEYNEGDLIEAVNGDTVIRARLQRDPAGYKNPLAIFTVALHADVRHLEANGYTVTVLEKAAPPLLPTEPGYYTANLGRITGLWQLGIEGDWYYVGNEWQPVAQEDTQAPDGKLPLNKLEPVPVTVQKVIDYLVAEGEIYPGGLRARRISEHFGVES